MGAQAVKKYFTPNWEEFVLHGELEDMLEAGLAAAVRTTSLQMKVLGEFRTRMEEHKKLVAEASKSDKEHQQALEGLQTVVDSMRTTYEQLQADLKEFDSNVLQLTKRLDNANAAQNVTAEALESANKEKRRLQGESESHELEAQSLMGDLEISKKGRKEVEAEVARLLGEKKEMEAKLECVEADFVANFHNTEAYTNFSNYFDRVGHQEVLAVLRIDHPDLDLRPLHARFSPSNAEGEEGSSVVPLPRLIVLNFVMNYWMRLLFVVHVFDTVRSGAQLADDPIRSFPIGVKGSSPRLFGEQKYSSQYQIAKAE
ncbi:Uncharacterized protein Adt_03778 [Abeliophyllum distichum]|uniref:Uncharacterized protein n=1 Tax=Abeliophyllum distichum TaxID=126358 RepID=A0ABD1VZW2_9LAMI